MSSMFLTIQALIQIKYNYKTMIATISGKVVDVSENVYRDIKTGAEKREAKITLKQSYQNSYGRNVSEFVEVKVSGEQKFDEGDEIDMKILQRSGEFNGRPYLSNTEII
jgi:hypothetical protein